jgi:hypothetical protein
VQVDARRLEGLDGRPPQPAEPVWRQDGAVQLAEDERVLVRLAEP